MGTLVQCQPHFIRCIKPNPASQPGQLDPEYVLEQLRAGGVLEAVRIACAGFPTRKLFRCTAAPASFAQGRGLGFLKGFRGGFGTHTCIRHAPARELSWRLPTTQLHCFEQPCG